MLVSRTFQMLQDASGFWTIPGISDHYSHEFLTYVVSHRHNAVLLLRVHSVWEPCWVPGHSSMIPRCCLTPFCCCTPTPCGCGCICFLTLAKDRFLFLSAVSSAARHFYCFPASSHRAQSQCLSLFGCFLFLLSCFTLPHPSAQMVWTNLRNSGNWTKRWHKCRHDFSLSSWDGTLYRRQNWKRSQKEQMMWSPVSLLVLLLSLPDQQLPHWCHRTQVKRTGRLTSSTAIQKTISQWNYTCP